MDLEVILDSNAANVDRDIFLPTSLHLIQHVTRAKMVSTHSKARLSVCRNAGTARSLINLDVIYVQLANTATQWTQMWETAKAVFQVNIALRVRLLVISALLAGFQLILRRLRALPARLAYMGGTMEQTHPKRAYHVYLAILLTVRRELVIVQYAHVVNLA